MIAIIVTIKSGKISIKFLSGVSKIGQSLLQEIPNIVTFFLTNLATSKAPGVTH